MKRLLPFLLLIGCAAPSRKEAASPSAAPAAEPGTTSTGAEDAPSAPPPSGGDKLPAPTTMPSGAGSTMVVSPEVAKAQTNFDAASSAFTAAGSDCAQLCKALSSMTNATERLCELAGGDPRCSDAKTRLDAARAKVKSTCGNC